MEEASQRPYVLPTKVNPIAITITLPSPTSSYHPNHLPAPHLTPLSPPYLTFTIRDLKSHLQTYTLKRNPETPPPVHALGRGGGISTNDPGSVGREVFIEIPTF